MGSEYGTSVLVATGIVFIILPVVAVGLRFYARSLVRAKLGGDDWVMIPALVIITALGVTQIIAAEIGQLGEHQTLGPGGQLVWTPQLSSYEKCKYILQVLGTLELAVIKVSILLFYRRIFTIRSFRLVNNVALVLVAAWGISFTLVIAFQCTPVNTIWKQFELHYLPYCVNQQQVYFAIAISDLILDVFIFTLPLPMVYKLQLPSKQKFAVSGIFLLGSIVVGAGITRVIIFAQAISFTHAHPMVYFTDITFYTAGTLFWTLIENSIGIIGACLPTLRPLFVSLDHDKSSSSYSSDYPRRTGYSKGPRRLDDLSSVNSESALRKAGPQPGSSSEAYVQSIPLQNVPRDGIMVRKDFYSENV